MEVMALAALAAQTHDVATTLRSSAGIKAEPEHEPSSPLPSSSISSTVEPEEQVKMEVPITNDVEMECDEEAEEEDEEEAEEEGGDVEEKRLPQEYKTDNRARMSQRRVLDSAPVREYPEELASTSSCSPWALSSSSPPWTSSSKRKRVDGEAASSRASGRVVLDGIDLGKPLAVASTKRKGSSDFLRKGQWTPTEERLARLLIEAFEEGYLPIFTGIRLRGYLAVQLQCDPMRISKKLCAGTIDGKKIPKNYGQKKFRLRKKLLWDREQAGRILATLERLTRELWAETGIALPSYLTLSSTRTLCAEEERMLHGSASSQDAEENNNSTSSPVKKLSPPANKSKKQKNGVVFPIIYLNLSKKSKQGSQKGSCYDSGARQYGYASDAASTTSSSDESHVPQPVSLDGESLQAAYDLLNLQHRSTSPVSSRSSTPCPASPPSKRARRDEEGELDNDTSPEPTGFVSTAAAVSSHVSDRVPSGKPTILRQQAPSVSS